MEDLWAYGNGPNQHLVDAAAHRVFIDTQRRSSIGLRVNIDQENPLAISIPGKLPG